MNTAPPPSDPGTVSGVVGAHAAASTLWAAADAAATAAGVVIREIDDLDRLGEVEQLWTDTWNPGTDQSVMSREMMRAMTHAGSYLGAAYDGTRLLGASFAFFGSPGDRQLHSHLAAVSPTARGRSVGLALKLHQRAWAFDRRVTAITWTFDPLVRRNAYFNIAKLGAVPTEYVVDFYGDMSDGINVGQGSDRLLTTWQVAEPAAKPPGALDPGPAELVLGDDAAGRPIAVRRREPDRPALVLVPRDIERLRATDPALARSWRVAMRDVLGGLLDAGGTVRGFTDDGHYVVEEAR